MARIGVNGLVFVPGVTGGSEVYFRMLAEALQSIPSSHEYLFFVRRPLRDQLKIRTMNARVVGIREPSKLGNRIRYRLGRPLVDLKPRWRETMNDACLDLVHDPYTAITPGGVRAPHVITVHDVQHEFLPELFTADELAGRRNSYGPSIENAKLVMASSEFTRQTLLDTYRIDAAAVVTVHIAAPPLPDPAPYMKLPPRYLFYPAASWHHKNHVRLLEAFAGRARRDPQLRLVLTGLRMSGADAIAEAMDRLQLRERVVHLGYVAPAELAALYKHAEALVFPSLFEGFGIPLLEAMAAGCPIVASTATSIPEVADDAALYFNPLDIDELAMRLDEVLDSPEVRRRLVEAGRSRVKLFSLERMARDTVAAYERALAEA